MCCGVYAIAKLSMSENQNAYNQAEETPNTKQLNVGKTDKAIPTEETQSAKQINADNTDKATPEEGSGSAVPAVQVEAVTKVFGEFQNALKSEDYEQVWKLMSEFVKSETTFEEFKKETSGKRIELANAIIHPESAINVEGRVGLLVTIPSEEQGMYFLFNQEDGQWKLYHVQPAKNVDTSKE